MAVMQAYIREKADFGTMVLLEGKRAEEGNGGNDENGTGTFAGN